MVREQIGRHDWEVEAGRRRGEVLAGDTSAAGRTGRGVVYGGREVRLGELLGCVRGARQRGNVRGGRTREGVGDCFLGGVVRHVRG